MGIIVCGCICLSVRSCVCEIVCMAVVVHMIVSVCGGGCTHA